MFSAPLTKSRPKLAATISRADASSGHQNLDQAAIILSNSILVNTNDQLDGSSDDTAPAVFPPATLPAASPAVLPAAASSGASPAQFAPPAAAHHSFPMGRVGLVGDKTTSGLDHAAIRLSNQIFLNTTEPLQHDGESPTAFSMPRWKQEKIMDSRRPEEANPVGEKMMHAKQLYVVNTPLIGGATSPPTSRQTATALAGMGPLQEDRSSITRPSARPAPPENHDLNRHRPANLGPSRFDRPEADISSLSLWTSQQPQQQQPNSSAGTGAGQRGKVTDSPTSILRSEHHPRPARNVTVLLDNRTTSPESERPAVSSYALSQSATFAYGTPRPRASASDTGRNFNKSPIPFSSTASADTHGSKYSVHFSTERSRQLAGLSTSATETNILRSSSPPQISSGGSGSRYGASVTFSESVGHSSGPSSPLSTAAVAAANNINGSTVSLASSSSTLAVNRSPASPLASHPRSASGLSLTGRPLTGPSTASFRAKSEGASGLQQSGSSSAASAELFRQIQVTKERHRENCEKALNFGGSGTTAAAIAAAWKPPLITPKLPRPGNDYARYATTAERDKVSRRVERERSVLDKLLTDRTLRSTSLENNRAYKTHV